VTPRLLSLPLSSVKVHHRWNSGTTRRKNSIRKQACWGYVQAVHLSQVLRDEEIADSASGWLRGH